MKSIEGCGRTFLYEDLQNGKIYLNCGEWKEVSKIGQHQMLKYCYSCLDRFYEQLLLDRQEAKE